MKIRKAHLVLAALAMLALSTTHADEKREGKTIVETAAGNKDFSTLVTAVKAAGLAETLSGPGPFTVFAPTNEAFAKIPAETLQALLKDKAALTKVLTYHVVKGNVMAADVVKLDSATTVQGGKVSIKAADGSERVNQTWACV